jgi:dihydrodipicolinate synthase/N-acetylneuraminate lyase
MQTPKVTPETLAQSVIAVPPLARHADYTLDKEANRKILAHLSRGGVSTALYGGNANLYNISVGEYGTLLDLLEEVAPADSWIIPSIGPDYGKALDQVSILRERAFSTAMALPLSFPANSAGVATGLRLIAERYGRPITAYVKADNYITPADLAAVVADGAVCAVKYALVRQDPDDDAYLSELVQRVDTKFIVSGIGERPAISHLQKFGLTGFTSGSVCIAPALSAAMLQALKAGDVARAEELRQKFLPLEDLRDAASPLRVLHAAVTASGVADTGPLLPFLSNIEDQALLERIGRAARELFALNETALARAA